MPNRFKDGIGFMYALSEGIAPVKEGNLDQSDLAIVFQETVIDDGDPYEIHLLAILHMIRGIFREKSSDDAGALEDFNRGIEIMETLREEDALQERESAAKAYEIRGKFRENTGDLAGSVADFALADEILQGEKRKGKSLDTQTINEIISSAIARAMGTKVERILDVRPKKTISSEKFLAISPGVTKESLISALLEDDRVSSAEYKSGQIHFEARGKKVRFNFKFEDEENSGHS